MSRNAPPGGANGVGGGQFMPDDHRREEAEQLDVISAPEPQELQDLHRDFEMLDQRSWDEKQSIMGTRQWFDKVQRRKELFFQHRTSNPNATPPMKPREEREPEPKHPDIEGKHAHRAAETIAAFAGRSKGSVQAEVYRLMGTGMTQTEAYRQVWQEAKPRTDKPMVFVDIEAASPETGQVDTGPYSEVIEVGYIKRWPDGRTERTSEMFGVHPDLLASDGTGAEHIHNISPDDVAGLDRFNEDEGFHAKMREDFNGSVIVAHSANYEQNQFAHNLPGFQWMLNRGDIEVLDTKLVSRYFMPDNPDNTNKSLVEGTGGTYEGAHRALPDAEMTMAALDRLRAQR